jgi:hypothetical protein
VTDGVPIGCGKPAGRCLSFAIDFQLGRARRRIRDCKTNRFSAGREAKAERNHAGSYAVFEDQGVRFDIPVRVRDAAFAVTNDPETR